MDDDLQAAVKNHQRGLLDEAARVYQAILVHNPDHAVALNLLGVVAHQQGRHQRAVELIGRAIALKPQESSFQANLAEAYRALGRYEEAVGCCQAALRLEPNSPGAANNLGLALQSWGQMAAAISQFRESLRIQPDYAMAHNNLGSALRHVGETPQALVHFRRAVELDPGLPEAHSNLGQLLLEQYQRQESLYHCREAVRLRPDFAEARNNLGNVWRELGRLPEAQACYAEALRINPRLALAFNNMGQALQEEGKLDEAVDWYQRGLQLDPDSARIHCNLASVLEEREDHQEALAHYQLALRLDPAYAEAHHGLGWVLHDQGQFQEALAYYREAVRLRPGFALALCSLGVIQEEMGDFDAAERYFREAMRNDSDHADAHAQLATLLRGKLPAKDLAALRQLVTSAHLTDRKRSSLHFGLAHVLDAQGAYNSAAEHLCQANSLSLADRRKRGQCYHPADHDQRVAELRATFTPAYFQRVRGFGLESERPIFIVGLPRSGTTLTEQILASHSQVFGGGELNLAAATLESLPGIMNTDASAVRCASRMDRQVTERIARQYLDRLAALDERALRVVDKMPENYLYLGLLATMFPRAKFIHCRRDLRDVAVSCWMTGFRQIRWANDPEHIASRFRAYQQLMEHWRRALPVPLLEVDYEEVVADLEGMARRLVAWCALTWEPGCTAFHERREPVRSASVTQVRQPIYRHSVARWKHYEQALTPLFSLL